MDRIPIKLKPLPAPRVEIINLIDVLITLIAFFLLTTVFSTQQHQIQVNLPTASQSDSKGKNTSKIRLNLTKQEELSMNGTSVKYSDLHELLKSYSPDSVVVIEADRDCKYQSIIHLMDILKSSSFKRISFQVIQEK